MSDEIMSKGNISETTCQHCQRFYPPVHVIPVEIPLRHFSILVSTIFERKADLRAFVVKKRWDGMWLEKGKSKDRC